jgi:hypothetical protein
MGFPLLLGVGNNTSATLSLDMGTLHGSMLCTLLYSLFTHECVASHDSNTIIKFADDTTRVGMITSNDETGYKEECGARTTTFPSTSARARN